ncbi:trp operon leader peptide [Streptomyces fagopyri]|uniref:trp operon leader peptide n=1 Tax=Streptomyces fagopyri TaxID=2662397 RepID=UPI0033D017E7
MGEISAVRANGTRERRAHTRRVVARPPASGRVRRMFAHSHQTWWWTAHPAAH